ncbi:MAG: hypothetical protein A2Y62_13240 [Candidatus Fischerbacteria bacterium RBG_13_37_8]|uniref:Uncharacterized protein n=1 Tax=Candidatus Fischerbacteria bacterium RBG_13_37_8 TaxID=1817863 RepID=A0A1F5VNA1_9BACT|nr:MAG: hypothetical protein A2Y62_13240 [Candidatus Fischerbacteria bacterium RBG_13_37_8]
MQKMCFVYVRDEGIYILSSNVSSKGEFQPAEPVFKLAGDSTALIIGNSILKVLEQQTESSEALNPEQELLQKNALLKALGFETWRSFEKNAAYFHVTLDENEIAVLPHKLKKGHGYIQLRNEIIRCSRESEKVGSSILYLLRMKCVHVFIKKEAPFILWRKEKSSFHILESSIAPDATVKGIISALNECQPGVFDRDDLNTLALDALRGEGFKSMSKFAKDARIFEIIFYDSKIIFISLLQQSQHKRRVHFMPSHDQSVTCLFDAETIASTLASILTNQQIEKQHDIDVVISQVAEVPLSKRALFILKKDAIFLTTLHKSSSGWILSEPAFRLDRNSPTNALGETALIVLNASSFYPIETPNSHPVTSGIFKMRNDSVEAKEEQFKKVDELITSSGYTNWKEFTLDTVAMHLDYCNNIITISSLGISRPGYYNFIKDQMTQCSPESQELGKLLQRISEQRFLTVAFNDDTISIFTQFNESVPLKTIPLTTSAADIGDVIIQTLLMTKGEIRTIKHASVHNLPKDLGSQEQPLETLPETTRLVRVAYIAENVNILPVNYTTDGRSFMIPHADGPVSCPFHNEEIGQALLKFGMMKRFSLYAKKEAFYILYKNEDTRLIKLIPGTPSSDLGETIMQAFNLTRQRGINDRNNLWILDASHLQYAGYHDWIHFIKEAKVLDLEYYGKEIRIIPRKHDVHHSLSLMLEDSTTCNAVTEDIGNTIIRMLQ